MSGRVVLILTAFLLFGCATEFRAPEGVYIPENFEEAYLELDQMFTDRQKDALRTGATPVEEVVLNFGMQLKEYWGLWQDSKMAKFMRKQDIEHPDRMITVIFDGYVAYLQENYGRKIN